MPDINTIPIVSLDSKPAPEPITRGTTPTTVDIPSHNNGSKSYFTCRNQRFI